MTISCTPFRISFVGGGTDIEAFFRNHGGAVISSSINKYMYISAHPFFEPERIRLKYSKTETVSTLSEVQHPLFRKVLTHFNLFKGIEVSSIADIISNTGMGSSSSFTVGLLHNLSAYTNSAFEPEQLAQLAYRIEKSVNARIGMQDHYAASFGGLNLFEFSMNNTVKVTPIKIRNSFKEKLNRNLVLVYIGQRKTSALKLQKNQASDVYNEKKNQCLLAMKSLVYKFKVALENEDEKAIGVLLHENWVLKKQLGSVSSYKVDELYQLGLHCGASGGKLLGAGLGGFLLFYCDSKWQIALKESFVKRGHRVIDFQFENHGSQILLHR
ncbi:D,D-heptose 7-phosphate kinase [hydrothermal vent metagenome]|uniref:D,D-heptose 7-phosphate kinase n=1 Tax=hydrothermal vent metagenome TaxID=652676 RepID=A0A3B0T5A6_9ZZZZ